MAYIIKGKEETLTTTLRQERMMRGWTQKDVANRIGITKAAVHDIETGRRKPSYDVLVKLLDLFGYKDPRELFAEAPKPHNLKTMIPR